MLLISFFLKVSPEDFDRACREGDIRTVKKYISQAGNVNATNSGGSSALHVAAMNGKDDIVKTLLEQDGINVFALDREEKTAAERAFEKSKFDCYNIIANRQNLEDKLCQLKIVNMEAEQLLHEQHKCIDSISNSVYHQAQTRKSSP